MESALLQRPTVIRTPDQRLRVFVSSTLEELKAERVAAKQAISDLHLTPVMFELGARPHGPRDLYSSYLSQSHVFIGIYGDRYGWIVPGLEISGLEDEFRLSADHPRLIYIKRPAPERDERLKTLVNEIKNSGISCKFFADAGELQEQISNDLALLLTERFEQGGQAAPMPQDRMRVPASASALIGRDEHLATIKDLLRRPTTRLLTLTGTGGIGKTRLAMEVAQQVGPDFRDRVHFVPLATVSDPELVLSTVVQTLFPGELGGQPPLRTLERLFNDQRVLLVLDNFEQVIDAAPVVAELLHACAGLKVLVTSREVLRLNDEQEFRVPMLALPNMAPDAPQLHEGPGAAASPAVQLFVQRAQAIDPAFALSEENAKTIAAICVRLDGLPLAIELAAARIRVLAPQAILQHLSKSAAVLSSTKRDLPERQRTLTATIDWSYNMLTKDEQRLLCGLSVFSGGCTMEAAHTVMQDAPVPLGEASRMAMYLPDPATTTGPAPEVPFDFMEHMESLVAKNLVYSEQKGGTVRFKLFATIREYAVQRAMGCGLHTTLALHHGTYFTRLAERLWSGLRGRAATDVYRELDHELDNLRAALAWALESAPATGLRLALALGEYWDTRGMPEEQIHWTEALLNKLPNADPVATTIARIELARAAFRRGDLHRCTVLANEVSMAAAQLDNPYLSVDALLPKSKLAAYGVGPENIVPLLQEGLALSKRQGYTMATIEFQQNLAAVANFGGRMAEAVALCDQSLELAKRLGATRWEAISYGIRGFAQLGLGELGASNESFNLALQCCKRFMDNAQVIYPLIGKAQLALARGSTRVAIELLGAVERFCESKGTAIVPAVLQIVALRQNAAKAQVGDRVYDRLHDVGRKLQLREAIELAERQ